MLRAALLRGVAARAPGAVPAQLRHGMVTARQLEAERQLPFPVGSIIEGEVRGGEDGGEAWWATGIISSANEDGTLVVDWDDGGNTTACNPSRLRRKEVRFPVGARVECNLGDWSAGVVVKQLYREATWPPGKVAPYQVKLDVGGTIYAPFDDDRCVRRCTGVLAEGRIPVTVLTGFLGAGKTTLLNYILNVQHGKKYAVIENEFGAVPIDKMLLDQEAGKRDTVESITVLDNGCMCCKLRDDLVGAMKEIVKVIEDRHARGVSRATLDGVLIETTGIADPGPIIKTFDLDETISKFYKVDGIITVVDAKHFLQQLRRERPAGAVNEPAQQVAFADKLLLNKVDLVEPQQLRQTLAAIRGINSLVPVLHTRLDKEPGKVPVGELLAIDAFDSAKLLTGEAEAAGLTAMADRDCKSTPDKVAECCEKKTCNKQQAKLTEGGHDVDIGSMALELAGEDRALDHRRFHSFLGRLLHERSVDLYRYKGVLAFREWPHGDDRSTIMRYILQGVHDMPECTVSGPWPTGVPVKSQLVLIGRRLEQDTCREGFQKCVYDPDAPPDEWEPPPCPEHGHAHSHAHRAA